MAGPGCKKRMDKFQEMILQKKKKSDDTEKNLKKAQGWESPPRRSPVSQE